jgi:type IV pilus assembly protein PilA
VIETQRQEANWPPATYILKLVSDVHIHLHLCSCSRRLDIHQRLTADEVQRMRSHKGFSLIELLIVVAIILIIAAIAIPNLLSARMAANESSAVGSIQAIKTSEYAYFSSYPTIGYATQISDLGGTGSPCVASSSSACLLDTSVVNATPGGPAKAGYVFLATGIASGGSANVAFVAGASPAVAHQSGNRDFCSTDDGVLRSNMAAGGDTPVNNLSACYAFAVQQ